MPTSPAASPSSDWQDPATVETMLDDLETWAVVGLSGNRGRTAYDMAMVMDTCPAVEWRERGR